jgi:hypothetical protein
MREGEIEFSFSISGEQLLWPQRWVFGCGEWRRRTHIYQPSLLDHRKSFAVYSGPHRFGDATWGHLFEIEKVAGRLAPVA